MYQGLVGNSNKWDDSGTNSNDYAVDLAYDANGNITTLDRTAYEIAGTGGNPADNSMDEMTYQYERKPIFDRDTNRLRAVIDIGDNANSSGAFDDIEAGQVFNFMGDPDNDNYQYDEMGNLVEDKQEKIEDIEWAASADYV